MDEAQGGGSNSPPPFLMKTYDMVDDPSTDSIVSWSSSNKSFVVWNPLKFSSDLLPKFFKHSNFSSFIRQLNTYGFRKVDPEQWEFANEDFVRGQPHMMKTIHRRKPIHSHSLQNLHGQGMSPPLTEVERKGFEDRIGRLKCDKEQLLLELKRHEQEHSGVGLQKQILKDRFQCMQQQMQTFISSVARLLQKPGLALDLLPQLETPERKRRLPRISCYNDEGGIEDNQMGLTQSMPRGNMDLGFDLILNEQFELFETSLTFWESIFHDFGQTTSLLNSSSIQELDESVSYASSPAISCRQANPQELWSKSPGIDMNAEPVPTVPKFAVSKDQAAVANAPVQVGVNDLFWEQFLTENPGSADPHEVQSARKDSDVINDESRQGDHGKFWWNMRNVNTIVEHVGNLTPTERT